jgi:hypothetical protein
MYLYHQLDATIFIGECSPDVQAEARSGPSSPEIRREPSDVEIFWRHIMEDNGTLILARPNTNGARQRRTGHE